MPATNAAASVHLQRLLSSNAVTALPDSAIRVLHLSRDERNGPVQYARTIEADPGLASQVLKFVNSSYFGFVREISSVTLAITLVGVRTIKNFVMWNAIFGLIPNPKCGPFDLKLLWQDSLRRAILARILGRIWKPSEADDLFAAALLQDMAIPLLAQAMPGAYCGLLEQRAAEGMRLSTLEQRQFGWTHAEAAGQLARQWNLPGELADSISRHTRWEVKDVAASSGGDRAVAISALLPATVDDHWAEVEQFTTAYQQFCGETDPAVQQVLEQVELEYAEFAPLLKLGTPSQALTERYELSMSRNS